MKFTHYFAKAYILFFVIPFPMLIYYKTAYRFSEWKNSPELAFFYLVLAIAAWIFVLAKCLNDWIIRPLVYERNAHYLARHGKTLTAFVTQIKKVMLGRGRAVYHVFAAVDNLSGQRVGEVVKVSEHSFSKGKFETGSTFEIKADAQFKTNPPLVIAGSATPFSRRSFVLYAALWLLLILAVTGYFSFSYALESPGRSWRFLRFSHPLVVCPLAAIGAQTRLFGILNYLSGSPKDLWEIKYKGIRTQAAVLQVEQTGLYVNKQPQVRFLLEFQDKSGASYQVEAKRIVSLLSLGSVNRGTIRVFYLPEDPTRFAFADEIENLVLADSAP